ncbi:c-type cytochrome [Pelistega ratti]|nr:c-type cytochrome [Pelistega ratti]
MMIRLFFRLAFLFFCCLPLAYATDNDAEMLKLFKNKICLGCHQVDAKRVGPSFNMVREKYQQDSEMTADILATRIRSGGSGVWGALRMPPQPKVSQEEAFLMAQWILGKGE